VSILHLIKYPAEFGNSPTTYMDVREYFESLPPPLNKYVAKRVRKKFIYPLYHHPLAYYQFVVQVIAQYETSNEFASPN
jgi:hypothetical protein